MIKGLLLVTPESQLIDQVEDLISIIVKYDPNYVLLGGHFVLINYLTDELDMMRIRYVIVHSERIVEKKKA